jgi:hypothetical protein
MIHELEAGKEVALGFSLVGTYMELARLVQSLERGEMVER